MLVFQLHVSTSISLLLTSCCRLHLHYNKYRFLHTGLIEKPIIYSPVEVEVGPCTDEVVSCSAPNGIS